MSTERSLIETGGEVYMPALDGRQVQSRMRALATFVSEAMREGIDYGVIPGTGTKRVLLGWGREADDALWLERAVRAGREGRGLDW